MKKQPTLRERALRLLARREHSRAELARKLQAHAGSSDDLDPLLDELARRKLLSDERYAEVRASKLSRKYGTTRVAHELRASGIGKELVLAASKAAKETEFERAREVWRRKFHLLPRTREERAKHMRFLQSRGFSFDAIRVVVGGSLED